MRYEISHRTVYEYDQDVSLSHHTARLTVRDLPHQRPLQHRITMRPAETTHSSHLDHFGNTSTFFTIEGPHRRLEITAQTLLELEAASTPDPAAPLPGKPFATSSSIPLGPPPRWQNSFLPRP